MFAGIDLTVLLVVCGCCLSFLAFGSMLSFGLGIVGFVFDIISTVFNLVFGLVFGVLGSGPEGCCGCIVLLIVLLGCGGITLLIVQSLSSCGTPDAVNFCRIFS